jgi:protein arginine kinase activator
MLCQKCQKRQATLFFSQTVNQETTQAHLCETCAQEQSQAYGGMNPLSFNPFAALSDFLNNFMNWNEGAITEVNSGRAGSVAVDPQLQCPHCGYQLSTFRQNGRLGCTKCYESFKTALQPLISSIHGNVRHADEVPGPQNKESTLSQEPTPPQSPQEKILRDQLKQAVQNEKFEEAAKIRDQIKKLGMK